MEEIKNEILNNTAEAEDVKSVEAVEPTVEVGASGDAAVVSVPEAKKENKGEFISDNVRIVSPMKLVLKRFFRSRLSVVGLVMFLAVVVFSFLGPLFVGWEEQEIDRSPSQRTFYEFSQYTATDEAGNAILDDEGNEYTYYTSFASKSDELY